MFRLKAALPYAVRLAMSNGDVGWISNKRLKRPGEGLADLDRAREGLCGGRRWCYVYIVNKIATPRVPREETRMPRHPDPDVEDRILEAAHRLWKQGGDQALTMRALARAARSNTPALYRRFKDRKDVQRALLLRIRQEVITELESAKDPAEACDRYLDYALRHPYEYELFYRHDYELLQKRRAHGKAAGRGSQGRPGQDRSNTDRPGVEAMRRILARGLGGEPADHTQLVQALWMVSHGAAMLFIGKTIEPKSGDAARSVFRATVRMLLQNAKTLSS
jgi:AcrR family transcriptional regulator